MAKIDELLETIDSLTVVELSELVKGIEENGVRFKILMQYSLKLINKG